MFSDTRIARRAAAGDQRALAAIFERYHQDLYRYCLAMLGSTEDAHDAVQNTMLKVLRALPGEKRDLKLKPWLYRIAHNEAIDLIRARRTTEPIDVESLVDRTGPAETIEARDRLRLLISDIAELPDRQRGALVMRELSGLSYEQIGDALQTSPAVARQTIYEARLGLKRMSEGREMPCQTVMRAISDEDGRVLRRRDIRAHLNQCESCQAFRSEISERRRELAALAPLPAVVSAGILQGLLGGAGAGGSGAAAGAAGAAAGKALIGSGAIKSAAAVCAVTAIGVFAADDSGLIHLSLKDREEPSPGAVSRPAPAKGDPAAIAPRSNAVGEAAIVGRRRHPKARQEVRQASSAESAHPESNAAPGSTNHPSPEQTPGSNGRHLGWSKSPSHEGAPGKPSHQSKEKKGSPTTPPGQLKSPGQAKHAASGKSAGKSPKTHPSHPSHPPHPDQSQKPAAEAGPTAAPEHGSGGSGNAATE